MFSPAAKASAGNSIVFLVDHHIRVVGDIVWTYWQVVARDTNPRNSARMFGEDLLDFISFGLWQEENASWK